MNDIIKIGWENRDKPTMYIILRDYVTLNMLAT